MPPCRPKENSRDATSMRPCPGKPPKYTTSSTFGVAWPPAIRTANNLLAYRSDFFRRDLEGGEVNLAVTPPIDQPLLRIETDVTELISSYTKLSAVLGELLEDVACRHRKRPASAIEKKHRALPVFRRGLVWPSPACSTAAKPHARRHCCASTAKNHSSPRTAFRHPTARLTIWGCRAQRRLTQAR
jgi:hypothetical protein